MSAPTINISTSIPQCAVLYMLYTNGPMKLSELRNVYGIHNTVIRKMLKRGLIYKYKDKTVVIDLTDLGRKVAEHNMDICRDSYETFIACKVHRDRRACDVSQYSRLIVAVPIDEEEELGEEE